MKGSLLLGAKDIYNNLKEKTEEVMYFQYLFNFEDLKIMFKDRYVLSLQKLLNGTFS